MNGLRAFARALGPGRLLLISVAALATLGLLALFVGGRPDMALLYADLDPAAARAIADRLKAEQVPFELSADGSTISAPADKIAALRMELAGESMGGPIGYAVLDGEPSFGLSASRARVNEVRALEGELARSIETLERVTRARVHVVLPERALFARAARPATAAVTLRTMGDLDGRAVDAIRNLVASGVPELAADRVSVVDQRGRLLARAGDPGAGLFEDRQAAVEARLREEVEALVGRVVGPERVRAEVAVDLDRSRVREEETRFDPDGQVVQQQTSIDNAGDATERAAQEAAVSVSEQLPGATAGAAPTPFEASRNSKREASEETSYQNSSVRRSTDREAGALKRLSVSVAVDATPAEGRAALSAAEIAGLTRLVKSAVGFDAARGDSVIVEPLRFAPVAIAPGVLDPKSLPLWAMIGAGVALLLALAGGAWALARRRRAAASAPAIDGGALIPEDTGDAIPALTDVIGDAPRLPAAPALERAGRLAAANPAEAAAVIRQWMDR